MQNICVMQTGDDNQFMSFSRHRCITFRWTQTNNHRVSADVKMMQQHFVNEFESSYNNKSTSHPNEN